MSEVLGVVLDFALKFFDVFLVVLELRLSFFQLLFSKHFLSLLLSKFVFQLLALESKQVELVLKFVLVVSIGLLLVFEVVLGPELVLEEEVVGST